MESQKIDVPDWVISGEWEPPHLKVVHLIRRNICTVMFIALLIEEIMNGRIFSIALMPLALLADYLQGQTSSLLNTKNEAIYKALQGEEGDHVFRTWLERLRKAKPWLAYPIAIILTVFPSYLISDHMFPSAGMYTWACMAYVLIIWATFPSFTYAPGCYKTNFSDDLRNLVLLKLRLFTPNGLFWFATIFPFPMFVGLWYLMIEAESFSNSVIGGLAITYCFIMYFDTVEYLLRVSWLSEAIERLGQK